MDKVTLIRFIYRRFVHPIVLYQTNKYIGKLKAGSEQFVKGKSPMFKFRPQQKETILEIIDLLQAKEYK